MLNFFEKEQNRLHNGEVAEYDEQIANASDEKHQVIEAYVTNSKVDKIDERSDGSKLQQNMILSKAHERMRALSMPDIETKIRNTEKFKK